MSLRKFGRAGACKRRVNPEAPSPRGDPDPDLREIGSPGNRALTIPYMFENYLRISVICESSLARRSNHEKDRAYVSASSVRVRAATYKVPTPRRKQVAVLPGTCDVTAELGKGRAPPNGAFQLGKFMAGTMLWKVQWVVVMECGGKNGTPITLGPAQTETTLAFCTVTH
ncbi:hypothetical protein OH76DRAFT_1424342 [Lentinus brumalis]|uniref:Uncharacterized protein n=1 Tax=Lentinus brumalis TaxID=2498619 RepID=A0A371CGL7_9APHY|nr:hypothetical protein OH76DRAFT_1424342 [Polyporus brumalis]